MQIGPIGTFSKNDFVSKVTRGITLDSCLDNNHKFDPRLNEQFESMQLLFCQLKIKYSNCITYFIGMI